MNKRILLSLVLVAAMLCQPSPRHWRATRRTRRTRRGPTRHQRRNQLEWMDRSGASLMQFGVYAEMPR